MHNAEKHAFQNTNFPLEHTITTTPERLQKLTTSLEDFFQIAPELAVLNGSGGDTYSLVTDGTCGVLVNAEGYDYPRYRGPRITLALLATLRGSEAERLCIRKACWVGELVIDTLEQLDKVLVNPFAFTV